MRKSASENFLIKVLGLVAACLAFIPLPSLAVDNKIFFQRGFTAAFDIPYNRGGALYTINPDTSTETFFGNGSQPNYSPDGTSIAFINNADLYFASASNYSSAKGLVVPGGGSSEIGLYPKVSPDNTHVAYQKVASVNGSLIYHTNIINVNCILDNNQYLDSSKCSETQLNPAGTNAFINPSWYPFPDAVVPNKWKLVYVRTSANKADVDAGNYTGDIFSEDITIDANGLVTEAFNKINLTNSPAKYSFPAYSHDGTRIAYVKQEANGSDSLYVANANGSNATAILSSNSGQIIVRHPSWSPDDKSIAYSDSLNIFKITTDTYQVSPVTTAPNSAEDVFPSWQAVPSPPLYTVTYDGMLRDKVSKSDSGISGDGNLDGTFTVQFLPGNGSKIITGLDLKDPASGDEWDTTSSNGKWVLGAAYSIDGTLLNQADGTINAQLGNQGHLRLFASDANPTAFVPGRKFTLTIYFSDSTSNSQKFIIPPTPALTLTFDGKLRDRVGQHETVTVNPDPDGKPDGTFTVLLPISGKIIKKFDICQKSTPCLPLPADSTFNRWDTVPNNGKWVVGAADTLNSATLLNAADGSIPAGLQFGSSIKLFIADVSGSSVFVAGSPFTLTATFGDNTTASATTVIEATPEVNLTPSVSGPPSAAAQQTIQYTLNVVNSGANIATGVKIVSDPLPANVIYVSSGGNHPCALGVDRKVTCTIGTLASGVTAGPDFINLSPQTPGTSFTFRASATANEAVAPNTASKTTTIGTTSSDLQIDNVPPPASINIDNSIDYTFQVSNLGPSTATGVVFKVTFPGGTTINSYTGTGCSNSGTVLTCNIGTQQIAGSGPVQLITVKATPGIPGNFVVLASVKSNEYDPVNLRNSVTLTTTVNPKVELIGLEVTQALQNLSNSVPLVAGKSTFVRAHVHALTANSNGVKASAFLTAKSVSTGKILGTIKNSNVGGTIKVLQSSTSSGPARANLDDSFYFQLPAEWTNTAGSVEFSFSGNEFPFTCNEADAVKDCKVTVQFQDRRKFSIKFVMTTYVDGAGKSYSPTTADLVQTMTEIRANFPMADFDKALQTTWTTKQEFCTTKGISQILTNLKSMRASDCGPDLAKTGSCRAGVEDFHYVLLPEPFSNGLCTTTGFGASGMADSKFDTDGIKTDNSGNNAVAMAGQANTRAHELGHTFGLRHTAFTGTTVGGPDSVTLTKDGTISPDNKTDYDPATYFGFDTLRDTITGLTSLGAINPPYINHGRVYGPNSPDMMSYGGAAWPSDYKYTRLFNALAPTTSTPASLHAAMRVSKSATPVPASKLFAIDGMVSFSDGSGKIGNVYTLDSSGSVTLPPAGDYAIRFDDASGNPLATYSFQIAQFTEGDMGGFSLQLPKDPAARRIVLLHNGQVLDTRDASANPPTITVTSPNGSETLSGPTANFTWTAADPDNDPLTYAVEYSTDGGANWTMLTTSWDTTTYPVDLTRLPASNQAMIRVTASDGFYSAQDQSDGTFVVPEHAPEAAITGPENNRLYVGDQTIILDGIGLDVEDGLLPDASLTWISDLDGTLGTGHSLAIKASTLQEGTHTITLRAQDSTSRTGEASITLVIARSAPVSTSTLSVSTTSLGFSAQGGGGQQSAQGLSIRSIGDAELAWTATADQSWIKLSSASGTTPENIKVSVDPAGLPSGPYSGQITVSAPGAANTPQVINVNLDASCDLDVDGDGSRLAFKDGILILRYMNGVRGADLLNGLTLTGSRTDPASIENFIAQQNFNVDAGSTEQQPLVDGLIILRLMLDDGDANLLNGITIPEGAAFTTAAAIRNNVNVTCGTNY